MAYSIYLSVNGLFCLKMMSFRSSHIAANEILYKKMRVHSCLCMFCIAFTLGLEPLEGLLCHRVLWMPLLWGFPTSFFIRTLLAHTPTNYGIHFFSNSSPAFIISCLFGTDPKKGWDDVLLWIQVCISLMVSDVEPFVSPPLVLLIRVTQINQWNEETTYRVGEYLKAFHLLED